MKLFLILALSVASSQGLFLRHVQNHFQKKWDTITGWWEGEQEPQSPEVKENFVKTPHRKYKDDISYYYDTTSTTTPRTTTSTTPEANYYETTSTTTPTTITSDDKISQYYTSSTTTKRTSKIPTTPRTTTTSTTYTRPITSSITTITRQTQGTKSGSRKPRCRTVDKRVPREDCKDLETCDDLLGTCKSVNVCERFYVSVRAATCD